MKRRVRATIVAVLAAALGMLSPGAQEGAGQMPPEMEEMMKLAAPGEHHKHLDHMIGTWDIKGKLWMIPGGDPIEANSKMEAKWVLGGRFVEMVITGTMFGMPFEGRSLEGYDNVAKKHVSKWVDNFGTYFMDFEGTCSEGGKVRSMSATIPDPMTGGTVTMRGVTRVTGEGSFIYEMFTKTPEGEVKMMELSYRRL